VVVVVVVVVDVIDVVDVLVVVVVFVVDVVDVDVAVVVVVVVVDVVDVDVAVVVVDVNGVVLVHISVAKKTKTAAIPIAKRRANKDINQHRGEKYRQIKLEQLNDVLSIYIYI